MHKQNAHGTSRGPFVKHFPSLATRRTVYVSPLFMASEAALWYHILSTIQSAVSRHRQWTRTWKFVLDAQDWATCKAKAVAKDRPKDVLALVTADEANPDVDALAPSDFLALIMKQDDSRTSVLSLSAV